MENGANKLFKSGISKTKSKNLAYEFLKRKSREKERFQSSKGM